MQCERDVEEEGALRDLRDRGRIGDRPFRRGLPKQHIPISTEGHDGVDTWLDALREREHNAPVMWGTDPSTLAAFFHRRGSSVRM